MLGPAAARCAQPIMAPAETPNARCGPSLREWRRDGRLSRPAVICAIAPQCSDDTAVPLE
jgi:hypothetical protein